MSLTARGSHSAGGFLPFTRTRPPSSSRPTWQEASKTAATSDPATDHVTTTTASSAVPATGAIRWQAFRFFPPAARVVGRLDGTVIVQQRLTDSKARMASEVESLERRLGGGGAMGLRPEHLLPPCAIELEPTIGTTLTTSHVQPQQQTDYVPLSGRSAAESSRTQRPIEPRNRGVAGFRNANDIFMANHSRPHLRHRDDDRPPPHRAIPRRCGHPRGGLSTRPPPHATRGEAIPHGIVAYAERHFDDDNDNGGHDVAQRRDGSSDHRGDFRSQSRHGADDSSTGFATLSASSSRRRGKIVLLHPPGSDSYLLDEDLGVILPFDSRGLLGTVGSNAATSTSTQPQPPSHLASSSSSQFVSSGVKVKPGVMVSFEMSVSAAGGRGAGGGGGGAGSSGDVSEYAVHVAVAHDDNHQRQLDDDHHAAQHGDGAVSHDGAASPFSTSSAREGATPGAPHVSPHRADQEIDDEQQHDALREATADIAEWLLDPVTGRLDTNDVDRLVSIVEQHTRPYLPSSTTTMTTRSSDGDDDDALSPSSGKANGGGKHAGASCRGQGGDDQHRRGRKGGRGEEEPRRRSCPFGPVCRQGSPTRPSSAGCIRPSPVARR